MLRLPNLGLAAEQVHVEDRLEQIVVTAPFVESEAETALPIGILSGEALREKVANTLGETLRNEVGVSNASFGTGVGQPIIRGQSGNRVSILQNGIALTDASNISPDHASGVEAALAERLEVLRGPSALLYGSGAIGDVINVIDGRIPERLVDQAQILVEQSHNTVNDENKTVLKLETASGSFGFHLDAFKRKNENVEIHGQAIDEEAMEAVEQLIVMLHGEEPASGNEETELENTRGYIGNSDGEAEGATLGFSYIGDEGFLGFSVADMESEYGLPPGNHLHEATLAEADPAIRVQLDQTRYDFKGQYNFADG